MKIRTAEQLYDALAADLIWRKKELTTYHIVLESARPSSDRQDAFLRGAIALLYAHWEGYVKRASGSYLEFVAAQRLRNNELSLPMLAIALRPMLRKASDSARIQAHIDALEFLLTRMAQQSSVPYKDAISTNANLSSRVLREIIATLGMDFSPFESKATLLDVGLLERRNNIAHGEFLTITAEHFAEVYREVLAMMEEFTTQVSNAAALGQYRRVA